MKNLYSRQSSGGLTIIETLVWIAIFTATMIAIVMTLLYFYRTNAYTIEQAHAVSEASRGLENTMRVIREGAYSSQGAFPIVSIAANDFVFYADVDNDALIERVHYYLSGTNLMRGVTEATGNPPDYTTPETPSTVAAYVRNAEQSVSVFRYFDELGSEITNYTNWTSVRFVTVTLVVNINVAALPNELRLQSSAAIRNLIGK